MRKDKAQERLSNLSMSTTVNFGGPIEQKDFNMKESEHVESQWRGDIGAKQLLTLTESEYSQGQGLLPDLGGLLLSPFSVNSCIVQVVAAVVKGIVWGGQGQARWCWWL